MDKWVVNYLGSMIIGMISLFVTLWVISGGGSLTGNDLLDIVIVYPLCVCVFLLAGVYANWRNTVRWKKKCDAWLSHWQAQFALDLKPLDKQRKGC